MTRVSMAERRHNDLGLRDESGLLFADSTVSRGGWLGRRESRSK